MHSLYFKVYNLVPLVVSGLKGSFPQLRVSAPSLEISMYSAQIQNTMRSMHKSLPRP